jgi:hypothetical protein
MGQLVDEIITIIALGDTRHPDDPPEQTGCDAGRERPCR